MNSQKISFLGAMMPPAMPERKGNQVDLLVNGLELFPLALDAIAKARQEIRIETYIFANDAVGKAFCKAMCEAAQRGVQVRLVIDGFGGQEGVRHHVPVLQRSGVQVRVFRPEGFALKLTQSRLRRMHRKIIAVDREVAFVGGINLIDDFNHADEQAELQKASVRDKRLRVLPLPSEGRPLRMNDALKHGSLGPRYDFAVRVQGPLLQDIWHSTEWLWWQVGPKGKVTDTFTSDWWKKRAARLAKVLEDEKALGPIPEAGHAKAQFLVRDNFRFRRRIEHAYIQAFSRAHTSVVLANAYFLPSNRLRKAILAARARGVVVKVLLQGLVEYRFQHYATQHLYGELIEHGVEVYEYLPSFLHAKVAVVDSYWATVGSSNLDPLSTLFAREANVVVHNRDFAKNLKAELLRAIEHDSKRVHLDTHAKRPRVEQAVSWLCYKLMVMLLFIVGFGSRY